MPLRAHDRHRQIEPPDIQDHGAGQHDALARAGQGLQHRHIPEDDLHQHRGVADELDIDEPDRADQPIARKAHDADEEADERRGDDAHRRDEQGVQQADQQGPGIGIGRPELDEVEGDVEIRGVAEIAEAERHVPAAHVVGGILAEEEGAAAHRQQHHPLADACGAGRPSHHGRGFLPCSEDMRRAGRSFLSPRV
jgi:hypothetical protein